MVARARWLGAALLLVGACAGGGGPARVAPRAEAQVTVGPPRAAGPACNDRAALTAKARRQLAEGRALGALAQLDRIVHACATVKTQALEQRVMAVLEPRGHSQVAPRQLFARAARERAAGHARKARVLDSRAAYALERHSHASIAFEPWSGVSWAYWSPDGRLVGVNASGFVSVLDAASGREVCRVKATSGQFSPDSRWLLTFNPTRLVDVASCKVRLDASKDATGTFSPHSRYLYWEGRQGVVLDLATLKPVWHVDGDAFGLYRFSKSGRYFAVGVVRGEKGFAEILDLASGAARKVKMDADAEPVFLPDERHIAIETPRRTWTIEDLATGSVRKLTVKQCDAEVSVRPAVFSDSGGHVALAGDAGKVCILDTRTRRLVRRLDVGPTRYFWRGEAFLGDHVVSITNGTDSRVYSLPSGRELLRGSYKLVARSGDYLVFAGAFKQPHSRKVDKNVDAAVVARDGSARYLRLGAQSLTTGVVRTPWPDQGRVLLAAHRRQPGSGWRFVVLDVAHARALGQREGGASAVLGPAGKRVLSIAHDNIEIWNATTGAPGVSTPKTVEPSAVAFGSPTSLGILGDNAMRYTISAAPSGASASPAPGCHDIAVDPAHGLGVGSDAQGHLAVCRLGDGKILARRSGQTKLPKSAYFSPDGNQVLVPGKPASLWDWRKNTWTSLEVTGTHGAVIVDAGAAFGSGDMAAVVFYDLDGQATVQLQNVRSRKDERSVPVHLKEGDAGPLFLDTSTSYVVVDDYDGVHGYDLGRDSRVKLGTKATASAAINSYGVVALTSDHAVVFRDKNDGKLLGTLRVVETGKGPASALWQDPAGAIEIAGDRTPWLDGVPCRIGTVRVPVGLCFDVLERTGVARDILEENPPVHAGSPE